MDSQSDLRNSVDQLLHVFQQGFEPFVVTAIKSVHGQQWLEVLRNTPDLRVNIQRVPLHLDATALVRIMLHHWDTTFSRILTNTEKNILLEVRHVRNKWAHQGVIHIDDVDRLADNISRLLVAVNAPNAEYAMQLRESHRMKRYRGVTSPMRNRVGVGIAVVLLLVMGVGAWWVWGGAVTPTQVQTTPVPSVEPTTVQGAAERALPCVLGQIKANPRTMIYHLPDGAYYAITKNSDVQCYDSVADVEKAGFRPSKR